MNNHSPFFHKSNPLKKVQIRGHEVGGFEVWHFHNKELSPQRYNIQWCAYHCTTHRSSARNHESNAVSRPSLVQPPHGRPQQHEATPVCWWASQSISSIPQCILSVSVVWHNWCVYAVAQPGRLPTLHCFSATMFAPSLSCLYSKPNQCREVCFPSTHRRKVAIVKAPAPRATRSLLKFTTLSIVQLIHKSERWLVCATASGLTVISCLALPAFYARAKLLILCL